MDQRTMLIALHEAEDVGWLTIVRLLSTIGDLAELPALQSEQLESLGISKRRAETIVNVCRDEGICKRLSEYDEKGVKVVTVFDKMYPSLLRETGKPPWVLYGIGRLELLDLPAVAMVGTRTPTVYGNRTAEQLARDLSNIGICVVSGLARGVDSAVHRGALRGIGSTIAVLGCGIDTIYPSENRDLYAEIASRGLLLSEFPPGMKPAPGLFPLRNRIIAGLTLGTVVVEAAERSGSLITADMALEASRDVFAVPGPIHSPKSRGTNALLQQGAKLVTGAADIAVEYKHRLAVEVQSYNQSKSPDFPASVTDPDEARIAALLADEPLTIDQLLEKTEISFGHLHAILLSLSMKNVIEPLPGSIYRKKA